jgi:hypothetical protein
MWLVICSRCAFVERERNWKAALCAALGHVRKRGHWGSVTVAREEDDAEYVLTAWGMERRKRVTEKVA